MKMTIYEATIGLEDRSGTVQTVSSTSDAYGVFPYSTMVSVYNRLTKMYTGFLNTQAIGVSRYVFVDGTRLRIKSISTRVAPTLALAPTSALAPISVGGGSQRQQSQSPYNPTNYQQQ